MEWTIVEWIDIEDSGSTTESGLAGLHPLAHSGKLSSARLTSTGDSGKLSHRKLDVPPRENHWKTSKTTGFFHFLPGSGWLDCTHYHTVENYKLDMPSSWTNFWDPRCHSSTGRISEIFLSADRGNQSA